MADYNDSYRTENAERLRKRFRERWAFDEDYREASLQRAAAWKTANPERIREHRRKRAGKDAAIVARWKKAHPERTRELNAASKKRHPETSRVAVRNRRARIKGAGGTHTPEDIADIRRMQKDRCANPACRIKLKGGGEVDHIIAIGNGGTNDRRNLQLLCDDCNRKKNDKDPIVFAQMNGFLI